MRWAIGKWWHGVTLLALLIGMGYLAGLHYFDPSDMPPAGQSSTPVQTSGPSAPQQSHYIRHQPEKRRVIIFVHGVLGDTVSTWTNERTQAYWPAMLAKDSTFASANLYVVGYPTPARGQSLTINELAENMRLRLESDGVLTYSELVFLSHSMGGLVTRQFLLKYRDYVPRVRMLFFFSTPTEGSPMARLASLGSKNPQFRNMYPMEADSYLAALQSDWLAAKFNISSFCAYEALDTHGLRVVDRRSATNLCTEPLDPIQADHISIVKPADDHSDSYLAFRNAYRRTYPDSSSLAGNGYVILKVNPWARVEWVGPVSGHADVSAEHRPLPLPAGSYQFRFRNDRFCSEDRPVVVIPGKTRTVPMDFLRDGRLRSDTPCP